MQGSQFSIGYGAILAYYMANAQQTDWYIDGTNGLDSNSGINGAAPLKTGAELARRLGPTATWPAGCTVHVMAAGMIDSLVLSGNTAAAGTSVNVIGTPTQQANAGLVTAYTGMDHATPKSPILICAGIADWTPYVGMRVRITAGANAGAVAWILKANAHGLGLNVARTSMWYRLTDLVVSAGLNAAIAPAVNDPVVVETMPAVPSIQMNIGGTFDTADFVGAQWPLRHWSITSVDCPQIYKYASSDNSNYRGIMWGSRIRELIHPTAQFTGSTAKGATVACLFWTPANSNTSIVGNLLGCGWLNVATATQAPGAANITQFGVMQGGRFAFTGTRLAAFNNQIWDTPANQSAFTGVMGQISSLSGQVLGYGIGIDNGAGLITQGTINLLGAQGDVRLNSAPVTLLTRAQLGNFAKSVTDFSYNGTATIGATAPGYVDVVVPFVDWTLQTVIVAVKDFLGIPGNLSIPAAQRTATGFRILSANVGDLSTVNWQISNAGRNIFLSI
jgi:hypothetical protein